MKIDDRTATTGPQTYTTNGYPDRYHTLPTRAGTPLPGYPSPHGRPRVRHRCHRHCVQDCSPGFFWILVINCVLVHKMCHSVQNSVTVSKTVSQCPKQCPKANNRVPKANNRVPKANNRVLPCITVYYRVLQCFTVYYSVLPCFTVDLPEVTQWIYPRWHSGFTRGKQRVYSRFCHNLEIIHGFVIN